MMEFMIYLYEDQNCKSLTDKEKTNHIINGIYSNIPTCCILSYIALHDNITAMPSYYMRMLYGDDDARYVRCVSCRKTNRIVKLRKGYIHNCQLILE